jgi:Flp pilus assembly protein TadD
MNNVLTGLLAMPVRAMARNVWLMLVFVLWTAIVALPMAAMAQPIKQLEADVRAGQASTEDVLLLAKNRITARQFKPALQLLDSVSVSDPAQEVSRQILRGLCFEGLVSNAEAAAAYDQALTAVPDDPAALLRLGVLAYRTGDIERARGLLNRSAAAGSGNPEAYYYLYVIERLPDERARALRQLLANDGPNGPWAARALQKRIP